MRKNIIVAVIVTLLAAVACWRLSRIKPATPAAPLTDIVAFGNDARSIGKLAEQTTARALVYDANTDAPKAQEILIPPGTWLVPEPVIRISDRKETDE